MNEKYVMEVGANAWKKFLEKNPVKKGENEMNIKETIKPMCGRGSGKSQAQLQMYDAILKGENEMNIKETLNQIYGKSAATNAVIKDDITQEDITNTIKTIEEEEWIWVKGFKGTDKNMRCKGNYQYELDKQFDLDADVEPVICSKGLHFCKNLENVFQYYSIGDGNRFFEVEALVKKSDWYSEQKKNRTCNLYQPYDKYAAKSIRFVRELTVDEVFEAVSNKEVREWADEQKKRAMETSIDTVRREIRAFDLCAAGYSPAFAKYISVDAGRYATAMAMASLTDVSMDVKVMAIFMDNQDE